jgi:hypothetical protein
MSRGATGTVLRAYDEVGHLLGEYYGSRNLSEETVAGGISPSQRCKPALDGGDLLHPQRSAKYAPTDYATERQCVGDRCRALLM